MYNCSMICYKLFSCYRNISARYSTHLKNSYFVTTPIFYVNASPHVGHLYSAVIADAVHRFQNLLGRQDTVFSTGTDEHGTKIQQAAALHGVPLLEYCTTVSQQYLSLFQQCDVHSTDFVRTTEERHRAAVHHFWECLKAKGHIYSGSYSGWYCVPDESFLGDVQLKDGVGADGQPCKVSAESGHPVEWTTEDNFMFRLSSFQAELLHWLKDERVVRPQRFHRQLLGWVQEGALLHDVSVSRPRERVHWGVPVPHAPHHTIYVWLEALVSYLTVAGYPHPRFWDRWPPNLQVIGKDILKFHGIYWPAFLIGAGLEPPRSLLCHSHWTVDGDKMSKSKGNVVDPTDRLWRYTPCGLRYFLLREGVAHSDGNYSDSKVVNILNSELADTLGNLLSRCCGTAVNPLQIFPQFCQYSYDKYCSVESQRLLDSVSALPDTVKLHFEAFNFYKGIDVIVATLHEANRFFESQRPWELKKSPATRTHLDCVLHLTMETLRVCGIALQPIVPQLCTTLLGKLGVPDDRRLWADIRPLSWEQSSRVECVSIDKEKVVLYKRILKSVNK